MKAKRRNKIAAVVFLSFLLAALLGIFIGCISQYFHYAVSREDLQCERLTFEKCEEKNFQRGIYKLYFEEYEQVFILSNITRRKLKEDLLEKVKSGETLKIYFRKAKYFGTEYFEACEIKTGNRAILSLEDYTAVNQGNQTIGLAVCPIAFLAIACVLIFVVRSL